MSFTTKLYWLSLAIIALGVWVLPVRLRKPWLLLVSYALYATWSVPYLGLLIAAAALNHFGARWIVAGNRDRRGKVVVAGNIALLGLFKYLAWVFGMFNSAASLFGLKFSLPIPSWALPLGISFYLFESISYIIDLMRKREKLHSFWDFQLFIAFFPKLLAGPILRAKEFLPQVERPLVPRAGDALLAVRQIVLGLALKLLVADTLGEMVQRIWSRPPTHVTAMDVWLMGLGFGLQVYIDFSAYTRMAIGSSKLCGIDLVPNFDHPFVATSLPEFWRRWHMSLSRWVRDYVFYPMAQRPGPIQGGPRRVKVVKRLRLMWAAFLTMTIFGVWHGAGGTFLAWGAYHGVALAAYHLITFRIRANDPAQAKVEAPPSRLAAIGGWATTMFFVNVGFIVFRAPTFADALVLLGRGFRPFSFPGRTVMDAFAFRIIATFLMVVALGYVAERTRGRRAKETGEPGFVMAAAEGVALGVLLVFALHRLTGASAQFVYFAF